MSLPHFYRRGIRDVKRVMTCKLTQLVGIGGGCPPSRWLWAPLSTLSPTSQLSLEAVQKGVVGLMSSHKWPCYQLMGVSSWLTRSPFKVHRTLLFSSTSPEGRCLLFAEFLWGSSFIGDMTETIAGWVIFSWLSSGWRDGLTVLWVGNSIVCPWIVASRAQKPVTHH